MTEFVRPTYAEMSARLRALDAPSRVLEGIAFRMLEEAEGDVWSDLVDREDDVWNRRDPEDRAAWERPPPVTSSFDTALTRKFAGLRIVALIEQPLGDGLDPAWRPWRVEIEISATLHADVFVGLGANPAIALMDAIMQVHGFLAGEPAA
jgi:hypothetical protein